eukprot:6290329-Prymnesium_polylepis.1
MRKQVGYIGRRAARTAPQPTAHTWRHYSGWPWPLVRASSCAMAMPAAIAINSHAPSASPTQMRVMLDGITTAWRHAWRRPCNMGRILAN